MAMTKVLVDEAEVASLLDAIAQRVRELAPGPLVLVGIREGGDVLAERLAAKLRAMAVKIEAVGALDITLYRDDFGHRNHWPDVRASFIDFSLEGKTVILVDDVLFTGRTIRAALEALLDYGRPARVLLAVLIDRGHRQLPIQADIVGRSLKVDRDLLCLAKFREQGAERDQVILQEAN